MKFRIVAALMLLLINAVLYVACSESNDSAPATTADDSGFRIRAP